MPHPDLEVHKFVIEVEGGATSEVPVLGADKIEFKIPESSKYTVTIFFKVKNNKLTDLKYKQVVKKAGIPIKTRENELGTYEPSDELLSVTFPQDESPGGYFIRGTYPAQSTYYANGEELTVVDWTLEITKK
ncbi:E set domain-containing protein [Suhomyces tanzawaensis NRRL Y-17324]|uniref:E set domain-containing protein n=1 Tax=Suhomyces tanzawaensis NRRL Y-17324 TaxID=984487 RepID=A0A1E4SDD0_9ASCO|nr:E set domain-containing protein [Suhomyces tanzawaensis NRRL Y-17324]ODV77478.1 E set domain-containing protein [Suhomyces tanzawaensis NRRL Y-17324]